MNVDATKDGTNIATVTLNGNTGNIIAGGQEGQGGSLILKDKTGAARVMIFTGLVDPEEFGAGFAGKLEIYMDGGKGYLELRKDGKESIVLNGQSANISLGGPKGAAAGNIFLYPKATPALSQPPLKPTIQLNGESANIYVGGPEGAAAGNIFLYPKNSTDASIHLNGQSGDIILENADCAEEFDISESEEVVPGTVMVLDHEGKLRQSRYAYDKRVVGVLSGAGNCKPGIVLGKQHSQKIRMPLALVGKVHCKVDAEYSPIEVGDLLTTSAIPGHAMKANDPMKAFGTVIGKALQRWQEGRGLIPILIALQ